MKITLARKTLPPDAAMAPSQGASVVFHGVVRELEDGLLISGIDYSCYPSMAKRRLTALVEEARALFGHHGGAITHRVGFVAAGEPAITIKVQTERSDKAFEACRWYLQRIKQEVPIWKKPIFVESSDQA